MAAKSKFLFVYFYPEKKWLDRVQTAFAAAYGPGRVVAWDERKFRSRTWQNEMAQVMEGASLSVLFVSDLFIESEFFRSAREALAAHEKAGGPPFRWVLVSHCLYEAAGLDDQRALHGLDWPLDALSGAKREILLAEILGNAQAIASGNLAPPSEELPATPSLDMPLAAQLGAVIQTRVRSVLKLRRLARAISWFALLSLIVGVVAGVMRGNLPLLILITGFALLIASLASSFKKRIAVTAQSIIAVRCLRTGLADEALPPRQRGAFIQKAQEILGLT